MKVIKAFITHLAALTTAAAAPSLALTETDQSLGAGSYIHATGAANGVWSGRPERGQ
jgi:hypothetical protein